MKSDRKSWNAAFPNTTGTEIRSSPSGCFCVCVNTLSAAHNCASGSPH